MKKEKKSSNLIIFAWLILIILILGCIIYVSETDLAGMARKVLPAYNEQQKQSKTLASSRPLDKVIISTQATLNKLFEIQKKIKAAEICSELEATNKKLRGKAKDALCKDPDNDNFKKADGVYSYVTNPNLIKGNGLKLGCNVVYDTCKQDGLPYLYEQRCSFLNVPEQLMYDCRIMGPNYVCKKGACVDMTKPKIPLCGDLVLDVGEECEDGNMIDGDGCSKECKIEPKKPDLKVGQIFDEVLSQFCVNSLHFEICNNGEGSVKNNFMISVEANGNSILFKYEVSAFGNIEPGKCVDYINPIKLNILKFGKLDNNYDFTIKLDINDEIAEKDENNNEKTQSVYTGDNYYFKPNDKSGENICDAWCFDTDEGKDYWTAGNISYMYVSSPNTDDDKCDEYYNFKNKAKLSEKFCVEPIYKLDNGLFVLPRETKEVDCTLLDAKCENGQCVPIDKSYLSCKDYESGGIDYFKFGTVDYTSIEGEKMSLPDTCKDEEYIQDYYCNSDNELADYSETSCYYLNAVCQNGACVKVDKENQCEDTDSENDPFMFGVTDFTKFNGIVDTNNDECFGGDKTKLRQWFCLDSTTPPQAIDIDCTQYKNEFGPAVCSSGKCVYPNPSLKKCIEDKDNGLDYYKWGNFESTNEYGEDYNNGDYCINDKLLLEFFCSEDELQMAPPYDCTSEGNKVCKDGACVVKDESLKTCVFNGNQYEYTDEFGGLMYESEGACSFTNKEPYEKSSMQATDYLVNYFCDGNKLGSSVVDCTKLNKKCFNGECMTPNPALEKCVEGKGWYLELDPKDPFKKGVSTYFNEFGFGTDPQADYCAGDVDEFTLNEFFCEGKKVNSMDINCKDYGMKCNDAKSICQKADPALASCTDTDGSNDINTPGTVFIINEFGDSLETPDECDGLNVIIERTCELNNLKVYSSNCALGKQCKKICDANNTYLGSACVDANDNSNVCKATEEAQPISSDQNNGGGGWGK